MSSNEAESTELRTYRGNCHCGAFVYEAELPEITTVTECNCSICTKKGYLFVGTNAATHFKVVKGSLEDLSEYTFGPQSLQHKFCPICATAMLGTCPGTRLASGNDIFLNAHAIQGVNTWTLKRTPIDGSKLGTPYEEPKYNGPLPTVEIEGGKLYTGSCHCGKLTIAVLNKALEDDKDSGMIECNCSICERNAYLWVYPKRDQVVFQAADKDIGYYRFNHKVLAKTFCKTCGINIANPSNELLTAEDLAAMPERARAYVDHHKTMYPVNVRTFHGVDLERLHIYRLDGASKIQPPYVNP